VGYIQRQQYEIAREKLEKALEQSPNNVEVYKMMAYLYTVIGDPAKAEDYYREALDIKDDDPEIHNSYGTFLCQQGRGEEAQKEFSLAYNNPFYKTQYLARSNAGTCLIKLGRYADAEIQLRRALQVQPTMPDALLSMAEVGVHTDKYLMARAYIQRFHDVSKPTAESLWLQMQTEHALGADDYFEKARAMLLERFPDSQQAGWASGAQGR
jgi:type IV pilus assembly protein PilF